MWFVFHLFRDPSKRLGSAQNSPQDIKACSFFDNINWDDIFGRVKDGPWVPPSDRKRSKSSGECFNKTSVNGKTGGVLGGLILLF
jgi:hypothetical protein